MPDEKQMRESLEDIKRKLMVMEWDQSHNQLNPGRLGIFTELKEQRLKLETELAQSVEKDGIQPEVEANSEISKIE